MQSYTRAAPSRRYTELIALYRQMHENGQPEAGRSAESMFAGQSLLRQAPIIKQMVDRFSPKTMLDYGAGKGCHYKTPLTAPDGVEFANVQSYWGVESMTLYDPAFAPHSSLPQGPFDGVICTDVLEHCPEDDVAWILAELFAYARLFVYANIASYPAQKSLPNGENAHCTVQPLEWWQTRLKEAASKAPNVRYLATVDQATGQDQNGVLQVQTGVLSG